MAKVEVRVITRISSTESSRGVTVGTLRDFMEALDLHGASDDTPVELGPEFRHLAVTLREGVMK